MEEIFIIQKCQNCKTPFSWRQIYRSFWGWVYRPIVCKKCDTKHKITVPGRFTNVSLTIAPALVFMNFLSPFESFIVTIAIGVTIFFIGSIIAPFLVTYRRS